MHGQNIQGKLYPAIDTPWHRGHDGHEVSQQRGKVMSDPSFGQLPEDPFPGDPFAPEPTVLDRRESEYTGSEIHALIAPVLGVSAEQIRNIAFIVDTDQGLTFGGTRGQDAAKLLLCSAVMSGILEAT